MNKKNVVANRYEVVQHIGQGGMADVFLAIDTILNRHVAIKILRSDQSTDAISILRFEREAQAATTLAHPNIVEIYDVGEYKNHHYIVMEYVAGKTLKKVIRDRAPLLNLEAVDTMKQLTSAVAEAHNIIHRDIKPQNVIVKSDGSLKILDFGIATAKGSAQLTQANNVMGSVHYLAPELAKGEPASPQSDIYALGIVFYEMLTGDVPFKADQAVQIALQHMREPMPSVRKANPNVPQSVENIIIRATAKNPRLRYQSCDEMLKDLEKCMLPEHQNDKPLSLNDPIDKTPTKQEKEDTKVGVTRSTSLSRVANKRTKIYITAILVLFAMFAVIAGLFLAGILPPKSRNVTVPNVSNMDIAQATSALENEDLEVDTDNITYQLSKDSIEGVVIGTEPASSSEVERHSKVKLIVSSGVGEEMPNYVGKNIDDVKASLPSSIHLIEKEEQSDKKPGTIIRQEGVAAGDLYDTAGETDVTLYYVPYVKVTIPADIIGKPIEEATSQLEAMGVTVVRAHRDTSALSQSEIDKIKVGTVIETMPAAGSEYTQKKDSYVTLYFY